MTFNSLPFIFFFPIVFLLYWGAGTAGSKGWRIQNVILLSASYLFYAWWDWRYMCLLAGVTVTTYITSLLTARRHHALLWTTVNIVICTLTLIVFKYFNFFSENLQWLFATFGWNIDWFTLEVLLPVGISFYTFQAIGYSVDVYRREVEAERNLGHLALFLCYFPQLVAGPIERASHLMPQLTSPRQWHYGTAVDGARQALWGMFKKVVIADSLAVYVDGVMSHPSYYLDITPISIIVALVTFSLVLYCDFSGYCDIARGVSRCLGIELMQNFRFPLFSRNVKQWWQRWNVSLMQWFRTYIYIPLGGSHCSRLRTSINLMIVFLISGLWHGAAWTFVLWGAFWGVASVSARFLPKRRLAIASPYNGIPSMLALSTLSYVFFRSESTAGMLKILPISLVSMALLALVGEIAVLAWHKLGHRIRTAIGAISATAALAILIASVILNTTTTIAAICRWLPWVWGVVMLIVEWRARHLTHGLQRVPHSPALRLCSYMAILLLILTSTAEPTQFIYFQF